jgi:hypothetical protein
MRVLGTSSQGNLIVEIEKTELDVVLGVYTVLRGMLTACGVATAVPVGKPPTEPRTAVKPVAPSKAPANAGDQKPNAKCATCGKPFRRRTSEKACPVCRGAVQPKAAGAKVTVIPPKPVTQRQVVLSSDPLDTVNRLANQTRREDAGE